MFIFRLGVGKALCKEKKRKGNCLFLLPTGAVTECASAHGWFKCQSEFRKCNQTSWVLIRIFKVL